MSEICSAVRQRSCPWPRHNSATPADPIDPWTGRIIAAVNDLPSSQIYGFCGLDARMTFKRCVPSRGRLHGRHLLFIAVGIHGSTSSTPKFQIPIYLARRVREHGAHCSPRPPTNTLPIRGLVDKKSRGSAQVLCPIDKVVGGILSHVGYW